ncbi:MAG: HAD-IC family P-type ATPase [Corynebacterium sp.]|nr:HAD-IC family P-type ATPase [Corynebacterium sp.]
MTTKANGDFDRANSGNSVGTDNTTGGTGTSTTAVVDSVQEAINSARTAAHAAGINPDHVVDETPVLRTSYAFNLSGLKDASIIRTIEKEIESLGVSQVECDTKSVDATIIFSTKTAWVTAPSNVTPEAVGEIFANYEIEAHLTPASQHRQAELQETYERRRRMSEHRHSRNLLLGGLRAKHQDRVEQEQSLAQRKSGFLNQDHIYKERAPRDVLFTARALLTGTRLVVSFLFTLPVMLLFYNTELQFPYWQWVCLALSIPVVTYGAWPFHRAALGGVRRGMSALDASSSIAIISAWLWSAASLVITPAGDRDWHFQGQWLAERYARVSNGELFLDVACGITVLLLFGRLMSRRATTPHMLTELLDRAHLIPKMVTVVRKNPTGAGSVTMEIPVKEIRAGDDLVVPAGVVIPADGEVIGGKSTAKGGILTTVSMKEVKVGNHVFAGMVNLDEEIKLRVTRAGSRTRIAIMKRWLKEATHQEDHNARLAIRSASFLVPATISVAISTFGMWWFLSGNANTAFACALAVLASVCPVALALSTSLTMRLGVEKAARLGIFVRNADMLRTIDSLTAVIFNRVGTLTEEDMSVKTVVARKGENPDLVLRVAAALLMESDHSVSRAIVRADREARDAGTKSEAVPSWIEVHNSVVDENGAFCGIIEIPMERSDGDLEKVQVNARIWRPRDLSELDACLVPAATAGGTPLIVSWKGVARGVITLSDKNKPEALDAIAAVENLGVRTIMITRDTYPVARRFADNLGISGVLAGIAPGKKAASVRSIHAGGDVVAMVGDSSISDCLRVADIGILIGGTADLENDDADVVILSEDVMAIPNLMILARRANKRARRNISFTWAYNGIVVGLSAFGLLHPMAATVLMIIASLVVEYAAFGREDLPWRKQPI